MNLAQVTAALEGLEFGSIRFFNQIDSTNAEAARWVDVGCPDLALVAADEQTAGRGRAGRRWFTPPGSALAFSLVLRPNRHSHGDAWPVSLAELPRITALGALAVCETLQARYELPAQIKWPNDVLYSGQKCCGVLAESIWQGDRLAAIILGIGINVTPDSVPPIEALTFPATSVESALLDCHRKHKSVNRLELLRAVLEELLRWHVRVADQEFIQAWENRLAFQNQWVRVSLPPTGTDESSASSLEGILLGLESDGQLRLRDRSGQLFILRSGELNLRPL